MDLRRDWKKVKSESESDSGEMTQSTLRERDLVWGTRELKRFEMERQWISALMSEMELKTMRIKESGSRSKPSIPPILCLFDDDRFLFRVSLLSFLY